MKKITIYTLLAGTLVNLNVAKSEESSILELEKVTVSANRSDREIEDLSSKVTVITEEDIKKYSHKNIRDLVKYEPGVIVSGLGRFGLSGFNIRGVGGDRILTLVDGVPIADEFSFGPNLSARRNFIDIDSLKAVEIVRGPASSLYGSNAIGGLVTFVTKDPIDYISDGENSFSSIKMSYDSVDDSINNTFTYARGNERWQGLILGTYRNGNEYETFFNDDSTGDSRRSANPIDNTDYNVLAKVSFTPSENHQFKITTEYFNSDTDTNALSQAGSIVFGTVKQSVKAKDSRKRKRIAFEYNGYADKTFYDEVVFNLYNQNSESEQITFEERLTPSQINQFRTRDSFFDQDNLGFKLNFIKNFETKIRQQWVYGFDFDEIKTNTLRAGQTINSATGEQLPEFSNFPTRDFPNSEYQSYGIFVQNELTFLSGDLTVIPSIRYDNFKLTPSVDDIYLSGNTGSPTPSGYSESEFSTKLGGIYRFNENWSLFLQAAEGFKAPPIDAINTGFTNLAGGYTTLPSPDLKPESSKTNEIGIRFKGNTHQIEISAYESRYDNFIESLAFKGFNPVTGLLEFQARNLDETKIKGLEIKGNWNMDNLYKGLRFQYAYAKSDGKDENTNLPINSVQPESLVTGLGYDSLSGRWGSELIMTVNDRKTEIDDSAIQSNDPNDPAILAFNTPGFSVFDLVGYYDFSKQLKLNWGLFNLTNKKYWRWNDVLLQAETSNQLSRLTQPGRNASVTLRYEF
jgi:hemoglobin/transferrin/lactoferrin receptor protein